MTLYLSNDDPDTLLEWARERLVPDGTFPAGARPLGVLEPGEEGKSPIIRAVMVTVHTYAGIIDAHLASDGSRKWATRNILGGLFGYMFIYHRARRVQVVIDPENTASVFMVTKMGFAFEGRLAAALDNGKDGIMLGMTPEACKWIKESDDG